MTALVALDVYNLDDVLTVQTGQLAIGHSAHLATGEQFTVNSLLYATLVYSGNDAALTLAENYPHGGYQGFLDHMNQKAADLHLTNTHFTNVSGIESSAHKTTVHDLALLAKEALKNQTFTEMVDTSSTTITDITGNSSYPLDSTNLLLGQVAGLKGIKTGWTENAGECLVAYVERDNRKIITVALNSNDRFGESKTLIEWAYSHHTWQQF
jgi:D-alanyl-D-alanine carboxypeptidase